MRWKWNKHTMRGNLVLNSSCPRDQLPRNQLLWPPVELPATSTPTRSTSYMVNSMSDRVWVNVESRGVPLQWRATPQRSVHFKKCTTSVINHYISIIKVQLVNHFSMGQGPTIMWKAWQKKYLENLIPIFLRSSMWCERRNNWHTTQPFSGLCYASFSKKEICAKGWKKKVNYFNERFQNG